MKHQNYRSYIEEYVRYAFKHTAQHHLYLDAKGIVTGVNSYYSGRMLEAAPTLQFLLSHYRHPHTYQAYETPVLCQQDGAFHWYKRNGYPFVFHFPEAFDLHQMQQYDLCDMITLLRKSQIPL